MPQHRQCCWPLIVEISQAGSGVNKPAASPTTIRGLRLQSAALPADRLVERGGGEGCWLGSAGTRGSARR